MKIVYDVDDTLWDLITPVYASIGLTIHDATYYSITDNPNLTQKQIDGLITDNNPLPTDYTPCKLCCK